MNKNSQDGTAALLSASSQESKAVHSIGDLWPWPDKPGAGSGDFAWAGMTSKDAHTWSLMIHPLIPLTIGGGMLENYKRVTQALGGLLRLSHRIWGRNESLTHQSFLVHKKMGR